MPAVRIADILDTRAISVDARCRDKYELLKTLIERLGRSGRLRDPKTALADVVSREKEKGTGLEHGVAVPHCRTVGADQLAAAFALHHGGVDFGSPDGEPSRFIFLLISPKNASAAHVQALATMARLLKKESVQRDLLAATTADEVERILLTAEA